MLPGDTESIYCRLCFITLSLDKVKPTLVPSANLVSTCMDDTSDEKPQSTCKSFGINGVDTTIRYNVVLRVNQANVKTNTDTCIHTCIAASNSNHMIIIANWPERCATRLAIT